MPLPWKKKTNPNRISRIVADLQPASRAVQTGFPTSVVDLFVKNRDRIKKHSLKHNHKHHPSPHLPLESVAPPPTDPSPTPETPPCLPVVVVARLDGDLEQDSNANANGDDNANSNPNSTAFVVAAKMFLAVIPALSTQKLALGITLSAFLLFLLQIVGRFAVRFFSTTSTAERRRDGVVDRGGEEEEEPPINSAFDSEIQTVESKSDNKQEQEQEEVQLGLEEGLVQHEPFRNREKGPSRKSERSRSAKLRAKIIKKLIPKKLRRSKRNKMKEDASMMTMENEESWRCEEEDEEIWEAEEEIRSASTSEEEEIGSSKNLECKIMMLMIVLGLCGGRFPALVLTLSGCFIFKFIQSWVKATPPTWMI